MGVPLWGCLLGHWIPLWGLVHLVQKTQFRSQLSSKHNPTLIADYTVKLKYILVFSWKRLHMTLTVDNQVSVRQIAKTFASGRAAEKLVYSTLSDCGFPSGKVSIIFKVN